MTRSNHWLPLAAGALALLAAACSSGASPRVASLGSTTATTTAAAPSAAAPSGTTPGGTPLADFDKFAACMRSHGVADFPDPVVQQTAGGESVKVRVAPPAGPGQTAAYNAAANACKSLAPPRPTAPTITAAQQQDYLDAAACMRSHGITGFPDPVFANGGVNFPIPTGMNTESPQFLRSRQTCQKLIPAGLPYNN
jgi:hypothetical protein